MFLWTTWLGAATFQNADKFQPGGIVMAFDQNKYNQDFNKKNYDRLVMDIPKGKKQELKEFAATQDLSVSELIRRALWNTYKIQI